MLRTSLKLLECSVHYLLHHFYTVTKDQNINIQFHVAEDPLRAVARGTGIALKNVNKFSFLIR